MGKRDRHDDFDGSQVIETPTMVLFWQPPGVFGQWTPAPGPSVVRRPSASSVTSFILGIGGDGGDEDRMHGQGGGGKLGFDRKSRRSGGSLVAAHQEACATVVLASPMLVGLPPLARSRRLLGASA